MSWINQPFDLQKLWQGIDDRLKRLEQSNRFTAPNVDFSSAPAAPRSGDLFYDTNAGMLKYWNGSAWVEIADNNLGTTIEVFYPTWRSVNNDLTYTGNPVTAYYQRIGKLIAMSVQVDCSTVTNFGTGQYYFDLPLAPLVDTSTSSGTVWISGTQYAITGSVLEGTTNAYLWHPTSNGGVDTMTYNKPVILTTATTFSLTGVYLLP